jgi:uncharacterized membrane protein YhaH (DUF805 family)
MTTMTTRNPYVAPRAAVQDAAEAFQPVRIFSVSGRIGRARYIVYSFCVPMVLMFFAGLASAVLGAAGFALTVAAWIAVFVISIMLTIQRSHDFNMSGWLSLLWLVPLANLAFWFIPGTDGDNRYGAKTPPNSLGVLIGVWLLPILFVGGIVAAVSIPAYQDYVKRANQAQTR